LPNIKEMKMRWARNVERMGETHTNFYSENLKVREQLQDLEVSGKTILTRSSGKN
jgi:hypothetical protein